jgi:hypothetical protein
MNKSYVEEICLCFYIACSLIVILKNDHKHLSVIQIDNNTGSYIVLELTDS